MKIERIYSRKKFRLPKVEFYRSRINIKDVGVEEKQQSKNIEMTNLLGNNNKIKNMSQKDKIRKTLKIILILIIAIVFATNTIRAINPILEKLCISEAKNIATIISNEETTKVMNEYTYEDLTILEKDQDGKIQYIKSNIVILNEIMSKITENIQKALEEEEDSKLYIRLGSFTGIKLLAGRGPKIEIVMSSIGHIETNVRSELSSAGINQTLHKIILDVRCNVTILTPYKEIESEIENQIILAEDIIIGDIPATYYNLDGLKVEDSLEVIE